MSKRRRQRQRPHRLADLRHPVRQPGEPRDPELCDQLEWIAVDVSQSGAQLLRLAEAADDRGCLALAYVLQTIASSIVDLSFAATRRLEQPPSKPTVEVFRPDPEDLDEPPLDLEAAAVAEFRSMPRNMLMVRPAIHEALNRRGIDILGELADLVDGRSWDRIALMLEIGDQLVPELIAELAKARSQFLTGFYRDHNNCPEVRHG